MDQASGARAPALDHVFQPWPLQPKALAQFGNPTEESPVLKHLPLSRPIVFLDLETTGINVATDKIVELALLRVLPDRTVAPWVRRIHPGRPIPAEATAVHHITDDDVRSAPAFAAVAAEVLAFVGDADLAGFNLLQFDLRILRRELLDAGSPLSIENRRLLDVMRLFHLREPRDLAAAVSFYLDREHEAAHSAEGDTKATIEVFEAQLARYADLPRDLDKLHALSLGGREPPLDMLGYLVRRDGVVTLDWGKKHKGRALDDIAASDPSYLRWMLEGADPRLPVDTQALIRASLQRVAARSAAQPRGIAGLKAALDARRDPPEEPPSSPPAARSADGD